MITLAICKAKEKEKRHHREEITVKISLKIYKTFGFDCDKHIKQHGHRRRNCKQVRLSALRTKQILRGRHNCKLRKEN